MKERLKVICGSRAVSEKDQILDLKFKYSHKHCHLFRNYLLCAVLIIFISVTVLSDVNL